jgi:serum/glucocorticoid-regulated kinase 2
MPFIQGGELYKIF